MRSRINVAFKNTIYNRICVEFLLFFYPSFYKSYLKEASLIWFFFLYLILFTLLSLSPCLSLVQTARNIRHLPCVVRVSGLKGVCMFAIDCIKANGTHLGTCIDKFYFGSCCQMKVNEDNFFFLLLLLTLTI